MADMDGHIRRGHPVLFGLLLLFAILEGSTTSWLVSQYNKSVQLSNGLPDGDLLDDALGTLAIAVPSDILELTSGSNNSYPTMSIMDRTRFLVFTSWWTVVFSAGYLAAFWFAPESFISSIASHGAFIALTWLFWLAGAASLTAALGGGLSCGTTVYAYCGQLNASIAFAWIQFIIISILLIVILVIGSASLRRGDRLSGGLTA